MRAAHHRAQPTASFAELFPDLARRDQRIPRNTEAARDDIARSHPEAGEENRFWWRGSLGEGVHHTLHDRAQRAAASCGDDQSGGR